MLFLAPFSIDSTVFFVDFAFIENEGGAVTASETEVLLFVSSDACNREQISAASLSLNDEPYQC